jgi:hypothetical protein
LKVKIKTNLLSPLGRGKGEGEKQSKCNEFSVFALKTSIMLWKRENP